MCRCAASSLLWLLTLLASTTGALDKPDISWGDWIIIEDTAPADSGASILLRRITPKSVFVAPNFNNCPEGYRQDALGRCVKLVQVNKQAQWNFFLEKLNSMYAPSPSQVGKESGPFHINLPIGGGNVREKPSTTVRQTTPVSTTLFDTDIPSTMEDLITTIKVDRDTTKIEQETTKFDHETTKSDQETTKFDQETTKFDRETTKFDQETTLPTTKFDQESTTKIEDTTKSPTEETSFTFDEETTTKYVQETTLNREIDENQTESNRPEMQTISKKDDETVKRPFIIVVTGRPEVSETTVAMTTSDERSESVSESSVTVDVTEENSETVTVEPIKVKLPYSVKSKCDLSVQVSQQKDELGSIIDCEPLPDTSESVEAVTVPQRSIQSDTKIRFPSDSIRKTSSFVRFPDGGKLWENTRQPFRWPSTWEYQQHPDIMAWPPVDKPSTSYHHYSPQSSIHHTQTWSNSPPWHRRIIQRD